MTAVENSGFERVTVKLNVLMAYEKRRYTLHYVSNELKNDHEIVMAAVTKSGCSLEASSNELRNNREIVMAAVKQDEYAIKYASDELKNDQEIIQLQRNKIRKT